VLGVCAYIRICIHVSANGFILFCIYCIEKSDTHSIRSQRSSLSALVPPAPQAHSRNTCPIRLLARPHTRCLHRTWTIFYIIHTTFHQYMDPSTSTLKLDMNLCKVRARYIRYVRMGPQYSNPYILILCERLISLFIFSILAENRTAVQTRSTVNHNVLDINH